MTGIITISVITVTENARIYKMFQERRCLGFKHLASFHSHFLHLCSCHSCHQCHHYWQHFINVAISGCAASDFLTENIYLCPFYSLDSNLNHHSTQNQILGELPVVYRCYLTKGLTLPRQIRFKDNFLLVSYASIYYSSFQALNEASLCCNLSCNYSIRLKFQHARCEQQSCLIIWYTPLTQSHLQMDSYSLHHRKEQGKTLRKSYYELI